jgi:hypothetical protein
VSRCRGVGARALVTSSGPVGAVACGVWRYACGVRRFGSSLVARAVWRCARDL